MFVDEDEELVPSSDLMESMRAVGYSLETAIADLIDNSLAAGAHNIWVDFMLEPTLHVSILDDGKGMDKDTIREAMKLAGKSPNSPRDEDDLGRFGLGLKTASLSQCRKLTVQAKPKKGEAKTATWDLDYIKETRKWSLRWSEGLGPNLIPRVLDFENLDSGTLVVWQNLDLLMSQAKAEHDEFTQLKSTVSDHLSLVFHRFLQATGKSRIRIFVNSFELKPKDPFLEGHSGTTARDEIKISISGQTVTAKPFILPTQNKLSKSQREAALIGETMRDTQGFYIYRNKRLLTFGTWFRLTPKSELAKLARVRVDTPNTLDTEWRLGIMKSSVQPPKVLRDRLAALVPKIVGESIKATRAKNLLVVGNQDSAWVLKELGDNAFSINVNTEYPILKALDESLSSAQRRQLVALIESLETLFPLNEIYDRLTSDSAHHSAFDTALVSKLFRALVAINNGDMELAFAELLKTPPVSTMPGLKTQVVELKEEFLSDLKGSNDEL